MSGTCPPFAASALALTARGAAAQAPEHRHYETTPEAGALPRPARSRRGTVYWADLARNPENGWSLFGLGRALRMQKRDDEALAIESRFARAWRRADITLPR